MSLVEKVVEAIRCLVDCTKLRETRERARLLGSGLARLEAVHVARGRRDLALRFQES